MTIIFSATAVLCGIAALALPGSYPMLALAGLINAGLGVAHLAQDIVEDRVESRRRR